MEEQALLSDVPLCLLVYEQADKAHPLHMSTSQSSKTSRTVPRNYQMEAEEDKDTEKGTTTMMTAHPRSRG